MRWSCALLCSLGWVAMLAQSPAIAQNVRVARTPRQIQKDIDSKKEQRIQLEGEVEALERQISRRQGSRADNAGERMQEIRSQIKQLQKDRDAADAILEEHRKCDVARGLGGDVKGHNEAITEANKAKASANAEIKQLEREADEVRAGRDGPNDTGARNELARKRDQVDTLSRAISKLETELEEAEDRERRDRQDNNTRRRPVRRR